MGVDKGGERDIETYRCIVHGGEAGVVRDGDIGVIAAACGLGALLFTHGFWVCVSLCVCVLLGEEQVEDTIKVCVWRVRMCVCVSVCDGLWLIACGCVYMCVDRG